MTIKQKGIKVSALLVLTTLTVLSHQILAGEWTWQELDFRFNPGSKAKMEDPMLQMAWRLLNAANEGDEEKFCSLYLNETKEDCQQQFRLWKARVKSKWPVTAGAKGRNGEDMGFVTLYASVDSWSTSPTEQLFLATVFARETDNGWRIVQDGAALEAQRNGLPLSKITDQIRQLQHKQWAEADKAHLEEHNKRMQEKLWEEIGDKGLRESKLAYAIRKQMDAENVDRPNNYKELFAQYDPDLYVPPRWLDASKPPDNFDRTDWKQMTAALLHEKWKQGKLAAQVGKEDIPGKEKTDVQILASIVREVNKAPIRFLFYNVFDADAPVENQWITTSMIVLEQKTDGTWVENTDWTVYPGIKHYDVIEVGQERVQLRYHYGDGDGMYGGTMQATLKVADIPPPFDRLYTRDECKEW
mgnify:FL=1